MRELELFRLAVSTYSITLTEIWFDDAMSSTHYNNYCKACDILNYLIGFRKSELKNGL